MIDTVSERNALATKLKSIGMEVYLTILYPELKKDPNITWQEISRRYPRYNSLSVLAQQSRFSNARSIIRNGWEEDALRMIADGGLCYRRLLPFPGVHSYRFAFRTALYESVRTRRSHHGQTDVMRTNASLSDCGYVCHRRYFRKNLRKRNLQDWLLTITIGTID